MKIWESLLYGLLQGIAEFLPISSSGHLALAHGFFGTDTANTDTLAFDVLLHLATLLAVVVMFRKEILLLFKGVFSLLGKLFTGRLWGKRKEPLQFGERLFLMLCLSALPLVPIALISDRVEALGAYRWAVGLLLVVNGVMLWVSDRLATGRLTLENAGWARPFLIGCVQVFGVLPGISRSGSTITGGRLCGLTREDAVRFSFLMSIPAILGACVLKLPDFFAEGMTAELAAPCAVGSVTAFVVGLGAIRLLQFFAKKKGFTVFSVYSVAVGLCAILADFLVS